MNTDFPRIQRLPPYVFNIVGDLKKAARARGDDVIDFSMGNPDQPTPKHILDKLVEASVRGTDSDYVRPELIDEDGVHTHRYSVSKGIPRLRRAMARWYKQRYDVDLDPESEVIATIGSKEGLAHLAFATLGAGDVVLVPNPAYPIHPYGVILAGADVRHVRFTPDVDFFEELQKAIKQSQPAPKMLILNFPGNPTTQCVELDFFEKVVAICKEHQIWLVHDLAYADIVFDGYTAPSVLQVPGAKDVAVEFFTLSKSYNMPGWRVGFMAGNPVLVSALARMKSYLDYGMFTPIQVAAIAALEGPQQCVAEIRHMYQHRRDVLCEGLNAAGWKVTKPKATMFVWAEIPEPFKAMGSLEFSKKLMEEAKVAVSPGIGFGEYGDTHVRFALIENEHRTRQAIRGIKKMLKEAKSMKTPLKVGVIGLGTVGQGVVRLLKNNADEIERRVGRPLRVTHVNVRDPGKARDCDLSGLTTVSDAMQLATDSDVDLIVETIGGISPARELILAALKRGKPVATANKALLAEDGNQLFAAARKAGVSIGFEAAVAGGIPVIKAIREGLAGNRIEQLAGIINGTCNYILTQMQQNGQAFADALADAQKLGYAEADPTFDIEGLDAAHKLTILASIAFGIPLDAKAVTVQGITGVTPQDIEIAQVFGYRIKLLGIAKRTERGVELRVHPTLIPEATLLAKVDGVLNSVVVRGNAVGEVGFYGRGAGGDATASAVVADLIDLARGLGADARHAVPALAFQPDAVQPATIVAAAQIESAFYLRLKVADEPGVLSQLTAILAGHDISVEAILQREPSEHEDANVALITAVIAQQRLDHALSEIRRLPFVRADAACFHVEKLS